MTGFGSFRLNKHLLEGDFFGTWKFVRFSQKFGFVRFHCILVIYSVCAGFFICIRNSLDRSCVTMPS